MFKHAIVKTPCHAMINGITEAQLGAPHYALALQQHQNYIQALKQCGVAVTVLPADENFPDSCFVEDPAILTKACAIITNPGASSRKGETDAIEKAVKAFYPKVERIQPPGTLDGGDVMMVNNHFFIGLSDRSNSNGANQLIAILESHGMSGSCVAMSEMLHLKTGLSYLENNHLVASGAFLQHAAFEKFNVLAVDPDESYAANCIWVNGTVIMPAGFAKTQKKLRQAGFDVLPVDVSEFQKLDGGLSCLSLRF
ncbi:dimethylarginine dimethylaminohydrolase family protein [Marinicella litoralis]|uniref:Dimethylargininase n=1 Tax=Marinicella litoralis TaxID=644220 RepID=A0A4V3DIU2_9GAMM|nr:arginine deiminase family protein [Marinicella litoralis]TDR23591.1 dimethylargininase [Marinicella litoralis]